PEANERVHLQQANMHRLLQKMQIQFQSADLTRIFSKRLYFVPYFLGGRAAKNCDEHPNVMQLMDLQLCQNKQCRSPHLKEIPLKKSGQ
ncbi:MAG: hypothetical protein GY861_25435, partial [bacterium]|nr:hypothetical protein [bacterium]